MLKYLLLTAVLGPVCASANITVNLPDITGSPGVAATQSVSAAIYTPGYAWATNGVQSGNEMIDGDGNGSGHTYDMSWTTGSWVRLIKQAHSLWAAFDTLPYGFPDTAKVTGYYGNMNNRNATVEVRGPSPLYDNTGEAAIQRDAINDYGTYDQIAPNSWSGPNGMGNCSDDGDNVVCPPYDYHGWSVQLTVLHGHADYRIGTKASPDNMTVNGPPLESFYMYKNATYGAMATHGDPVVQATVTPSNDADSSIDTTITLSDYLSYGGRNMTGNISVHITGHIVAPTCSVSVGAVSPTTTSLAVGDATVPVNLSYTCSSPLHIDEHPGEEEPSGTEGLTRLYFQNANGTFDWDNTYGYKVGNGVYVYFATPEQMDTAPGDLNYHGGNIGGDQFSQEDVDSGQTGTRNYVAHLHWDHPSAGNTNRNFLAVFEYH